MDLDIRNSILRFVDDTKIYGIVNPETDGGATLQSDYYMYYYIICNGG